jgi:ABC-2 type transport system ATP-binding protein
MLQVKNVVKKYSHQLAVDDLSFTIETGKIFGLLGPNGAGKSSLLRMVTGITQPDSGQILFDGEPFNANKHNPLIGYMPEERGLYKKMKVKEQAEYLGLLKGLPKEKVINGIAYWFNKLDMHTWANKKVEDLSKGMSQKLQFVTTVLHQPKLLILDEPFSGLDPVNAEVIKKEIYALAESGTTIIFSTHRMEQVEEICDRIVLMNKGKNILEGNVDAIKQEKKQNQFILQIASGELVSNQLFSIISADKNKYILQLNNSATPNEVLQYCIQQHLPILSFTEQLPTLNDIFINLVEGNATTQFQNQL